ncbi:MAG: hypothetical protein WC447_01075 [Candidatus Paceibacterota bacterium]
MLETIGKFLLDVTIVLAILFVLYGAFIVYKSWPEIQYQWRRLWE